MGHIFISYSKNDIVYADYLINALKDEGFNPWVDIEGLGAGTLWKERLEKQIDSCDAYLLIISRNSVKSPWVKEELSMAQRGKKPILPLRLDDAEPFFGILTIQYEDVRGGKLPSREFYERLARVTSRRKKTARKKSSISLTEQARKKKVDAAAQKASYYFSKLSSNVKDVVAVASKVSVDAYKSVANSDALKKISSSVKKASAPKKKKNTGSKKKTTRKKKKK